jgi:hypothetical protein
MGDAAACRHAIEQSQMAIIATLQHQLPETQERLMDVMRRRGGGNAIDESLGHGVLSSESTQA